MTDLGKFPTLWDSWHRVRYLFQRDEEPYPEIVFEHLNPDNAMRCVRMLLFTSRDVTASFMILESRTYVQFASPEAAVVALRSGQIVGAFGVSLPMLPMVTVYVDQPTRLSIAYVPGEFWTPISMAALFLLLHDMRHILPEGNINLIGDGFTVVDQYTFDQTLADYL